MLSRTRLGALIFVLTACTAAAESTPPAPGAALYNEFQCAGCHEYAEIPGFEVVVLHDLSSRYELPTLEALLAAPPNGMPLFPLDDEQRKALAHYLRTRFP
jgi:mono/diheme cytochrome c family protein